MAYALPGRATFTRVTKQVGKFGLVGAATYITDVALFNFLLFHGPLTHKPLIAKFLATLVAMTLAFFGNKFWTFRHPDRQQHSARKQVALFFGVNIIGALIAVACLAVSRYGFGYTSVFADNISANIIGTVLGTIFRFVGYKLWVFTPPTTMVVEPIDVTADR